jgi:hypothetical protein
MGLVANRRLCGFERKQCGWGQRDHRLVNRNSGLRHHINSARDTKHHAGRNPDSGHNPNARHHNPGHHDHEPNHDWNYRQCACGYAGNTGNDPANHTRHDAGNKPDHRQYDPRFDRPGYDQSANWHDNQPGNRKHHQLNDGYYEQSAGRQRHRDHGNRDHGNFDHSCRSPLVRHRHCGHRKQLRDFDQFQPATALVGQTKLRRARGRARLLLCARCSLVAALARERQY